MANSEALDPKDDYDGRSIMDVIAERGLDRPAWWPPEEDGTPAVDVAQPGGDVPQHMIRPDAWQLIEEFDIRAHGLLQKNTLARFQASYLHFSSVKLWNYYLDTQDNLSYLRLAFSYLPELPLLPKDMNLNQLYNDA